MLINLLGGVYIDKGVLLINRVSGVYRESAAPPEPPSEFAAHRMHFGATS